MTKSFASRTPAASDGAHTGLAYSVGVPGLALTSATSASVIGATEPALISVLAWILLKERLSGLLAAAIVVAMFGVTLITLSQTGNAGENSLTGNLLIVLGTAFAALYVISSRLLVAQTAPLPLAAMQQTVGFVFALALFVGTWLLGFEQLPDALPTSFILLAVLSGIVQYALAFWFYLIGRVVNAAAEASEAPDRERRCSDGNSPSEIFFIGVAEEPGGLLFGGKAILVLAAAALFGQLFRAPAAAG